jgi:hypothetical protein
MKKEAGNCVATISGRIELESTISHGSNAGMSS